MADLTPVDRYPAPPPRPVEAHKGTFGTVIVVGGSLAMIGAPAICAAAALRSGVGLCKLAMSPDILPWAIAIEPGATGVLLSGDVDRQLAALEEADPQQRAVLAVGPGLGRDETTRELVMALLRGHRAIVLDADGLNLLATTGGRRPAAGPPVVMTPHPGEFHRLARSLGITADSTEPAQRAAAAAELAKAHQCVVLLKGRHTVVTDGRQCYINDTGNPALATAGSGDVLTGVIAALIAQGMTGFDAACLGAHLHGRTADRWADRHGQAGLTALALAHELPDALHALR